MGEFFEALSFFYCSEALQVNAPEFGFALGFCFLDIIFGSA